MKKVQDAVINKLLKVYTVQQLKDTQQPSESLAQPAGLLAAR